MRISMFRGGPTLGRGSDEGRSKMGFLFFMFFSSRNTILRALSAIFEVLVHGECPMRVR